MNDPSSRALAAHLDEEITRPVRPAIGAIAAAARARVDGACAVLFYGSCLRDEVDEARIVDLYVVVDAYRRAHKRLLPAAFNWLLPPNVGYLEMAHEGRQLRAKYAVISMPDFERGTGRWFHSYVWARFAQPCRLAWHRDDESRRRIVAALAASVRKLASEAAPLVPPPRDSATFWPRAFAATYGAELRAERPARALELYRADRTRYDAVFELVFGPGGSPPGALRSPGGGRLRWLLRRWQGKLLSVLRLIKAAFTFEDGAAYILWKIERHSGVRVVPSPWQRRHPILASTTLVWRLYSKGAFK